MNWLIEEDTSGAVIVKMSSSKLNLMNEAFFDDLNYAFDILENKYPRRPVILTSLGNVFSAGLDINHCLSLFKNGDMEEVRIWYDHFRDSMLRVFRFRQPIIAAVNGHAIAGGLVLALCCDIRIGVNHSARFGLNEVKVGFPLPATLAEIIKNSIGVQNAEQMIFMSDLYNSDEAIEYGIFHELAEPNSLMDHALGYGRELCDLYSIEAYIHAKKALRSEVLDKIDRVSSKIDEDIVDILVSDTTIAALERVLNDLNKKSEGS